MWRPVNVQVRRVPWDLLYCAAEVLRRTDYRKGRIRNKLQTLVISLRNSMMSFFLLMVTSSSHRSFTKAKTTPFKKVCQCKQISKSRNLLLTPELLQEKVTLNKMSKLQCLQEYIPFKKWMKRLIITFIHLLLPWINYFPLQIIYTDL